MTNACTQPMVSADEIRWTPFTDDTIRLECVDLLTLTEDELLSYTASLQLETAWLRRLVHQALAQTAQLSARLDSAKREIRRLRPTMGSTSGLAA